MRTVSVEIDRDKVITSKFLVKILEGLEPNPGWKEQLSWSENSCFTLSYGRQILFSELTLTTRTPGEDKAVFPKRGRSSTVGEYTKCTKMAG